MENNKAVLRDLLGAGVTANKQLLYFVIGSLFSYMGYNLVAMDNKNYTATTFIIVIGLLFYSCIMCNNIQFEDDNVVIEHCREKYLDQEDEVEKSMTTLEEKQATVASYTFDEKLEMVKYLLEDVCGVKMENGVVDSILEYIVDLADAAEMGEANESSESDISQVTETSADTEITKITEVSEVSETTEVSEGTMQDLQTEIEKEINEAIHDKND